MSKEQRQQVYKSLSFDQKNYVFDLCTRGILRGYLVVATIAAIVGFLKLSLWLIPIAFAVWCILLSIGVYVIRSDVKTKEDHSRAVMNKYSRSTD